MSVLLEAVAGPGAGQYVEVQVGQRLRVGRAVDADFSVPGDGLMSSSHFCVEAENGGCRLVDLGSTNGTLHNGDFVKEAQLRDGDQVVAGQTTFQVRLEAVRSAAVAPVPVANIQSGATQLPAAKICEGLTLSDDGQALLSHTMIVDDFIELLTEQQLFGDALRVQARCLPATVAVTWAIRCLQTIPADQLTEADHSVASAVRAWVNDPNDENRRAAAAAAEAAGPERPTAMVAMAAFWSGDSIAPPGEPPFPPDKQLTSQAIAGALMLVAVREPETAADTYRSFLQMVQPPQ